MSNMKGKLPGVNTSLTLVFGSYEEQIVWHDAATGRDLAGSDFLEPLSTYSRRIPGHGGHLYYSTGTWY